MRNFRLLTIGLLLTVAVVLPAQVTITEYQVLTPLSQYGGPESITKGGTLFSWSAFPLSCAREKHK